MTLLDFYLKYPWRNLYPNSKPCTNQFIAFMGMMSIFQDALYYYPRHKGHLCSFSHISIFQPAVLKSLLNVELFLLSTLLQFLVLRGRWLHCVTIYILYHVPTWGLLNISNTSAKFLLLVTQYIHRNNNIWHLLQRHKLWGMDTFYYIKMLQSKICAVFLLLIKPRNFTFVCLFVCFVKKKSICLHRELSMSHTSLYPNTTGREMVSQMCQHTYEHR